MWWNKSDKSFLLRFSRVTKLYLILYFNRIYRLGFEVTPKTTQQEAPY